jgi:hypothetical protein
MPTKMVHISNTDTIAKLESLENFTNMKSTKIVDKALDNYILYLAVEMSEKKKNENIINTFITKELTL